jgi:hypothetical protein
MDGTTDEGRNVRGMLPLPMVVLVASGVLRGHGRRHLGIQMVKERVGVKSAIGDGTHLHLEQHAMEAQTKSKLGLICANGRRSKRSLIVIGT